MTNVTRRGLTPNDVKPSPDAHPHWAIVCTALLYAACGGLDHSHNLVTPLSWGAPTSYGGPPIRVVAIQGSSGGYKGFGDCSRDTS
eukprot:1155816-Pelagomonas_calceolata.AAC.5